VKLRILVLVAVWAACGQPAPAQKLDPIRWKLEIEPSTAAPGSEILAKLTATMEGDWHVYSLTTPRPPIATTITLAENPALGEARIYQPKPTRKMDPNFGSETETFGGVTVFLLRIPVRSEAAAGEVEVTAQVRYQACDEKMCLPPVRRSASAKLRIDPAAAIHAPPAIPAGYVQFEPAARRSETPPAGAPPGPAPASAGAPGFGPFLALAFGFGLAAIFTPCVFPMIPITMSFFLNRETASRAQSVFHAALFALGIIVLFTALGLAATALLGPFGVVLIGSNPWVNGFIAVVFTAFALSLLGAFEITIPSSVLTKLDRASQGGGVLGTLLMGLTFSLTSFACIGPFVGTLLAASVQSGGLRPVLGMVAFAAGLASPFFLLALFPSLLRRMPRSGGWLARIKVVLGFVILAAALKYLSNIDQVLQWNFLTRERFLSAWVVLFALPGLYLLGFLRLEGVKADEKLGIPRLLIGSLFLIFSISLIPGMFGARLGEVDAYVPPPAAASSVRAGESAGLPWMKNQFEEALAQAQRENKLLFVSFTGYACTNCHWMKANMFSRPEIAAVLKDFVLLELYTDGADEVSQRNQRFQQERFATIAIPYYALMDGGGKVIATFAGATRDASQFLAFLTRQPA
jgi:thiol:disulfide interchange protein